jgi:hypothetical protein
MKYQKVFEMAEKFATLSGGTVFKTPADKEYQAQRDRFQKFSDHFKRNLKVIINEMSGELHTLKERNFNSKMMQLFARVYNILIEIFKMIDETKPYIAAEKLVHYITERPNSAVIDNLDFLAKHHLKKTNVDFRAGPTLSQPEIRSLDMIKKLSIQLREHMAKYPVLAPMQSSEVPIGLEKNLEVVPAFLAGESDKTKH